MHSPQNSPAPGFLTTTRLEAFSDGVFAVAITLLVLDLKVPQNPATLVRDVLDLWPKGLVYMLSFIIVGIYWVGHHNTFHYIKRSDRILLWLNIFFLMCIVFIPFPTSLLGEYKDQPISIIIYAGTLIITGLMLQLLWWYATSDRRLVDKNIDPQLVRRATRRNLMGPLTYLLALAASFLNNTWISLIIIFCVPLYYIIPGRIDLHWTRRHDETIPPSQQAHEDRHR